MWKSMLDDMRDQAMEKQGARRLTADMDTYEAYLEDEFVVATAAWREGSAAAVAGLAGPAA